MVVTFVGDFQKNWSFHAQRSATNAGEPTQVLPVVNEQAMCLHLAHFSLHV